MSRYFSSKYSGLIPYVPGEQPRDKKYIKLNTNESPFPPSPLARKLAAEAAGDLQLYSDPTNKALTDKLAALYGIDPGQIIFTNGSDEALNFAFMAFCDETCPAVFPDITYGFYSVFADLNAVPCRQIPLKEDFTIAISDYFGCDGTVFIANPNAPTGLALSLNEIEAILQANPGNVVVVDEAYVDFGGESALPLIDKYDNLLVIQTFSKSRSLAGGRLGMAMGSEHLIRDLNTIKFSTNPYNVNRMTMAAGIGALEDKAYFEANCQTILANRAWTTDALKSLGFTVTDSKTNFVFARHPDLAGRKLYQQLKDRGILIRHFDTPRLTDYIRVTIGTKAQMEAFIAQIRSIMEESL